MKWVSTRGASPPVPFIDALFAGTAPDGGLYMPERLDPLPAGTVRVAARRRHRRDRNRGSARTCFGDEITPDATAPARRDALDFPVPLVQVTDRVWVLELFHGPTLAFKDVGARVQARLLHHFTDGTPLTILVATSGDTGSAVAQAFHRVPDTRVVVLYPEGQGQRRPGSADGVARRQHHGGGGARGRSTTASALVKQAFADDDLRRHVWLTPANSINLGRLLPQVFYYFVLARLARPVRTADRLGAERELRQPDGRPDRQAASACPCRISWPRPTSTTPCPSICAPGTTSRARRCGRWPTRWTSARPATSSASRRSTATTSPPSATTSTAAPTSDARVVAEIATRAPRARLRARSAQRDRVAGAAGCARRRIRARRASFSPRRIPAKFREIVEPAIGQPVPLPRALRRRSAVRDTPCRCRVELRRAASVHSLAVRLAWPTCSAEPAPQLMQATTMPTLDMFRPEPANLPARDAIPHVTRGTCSAICASWDDVAASYATLDAAINAFTTLQGTLAQGPTRC